MGKTRCLFFTVPPSQPKLTLQEEKGRLCPVLGMHVGGRLQMHKDQAPRLLFTPVEADRGEHFTGHG